MKRSDSLIYVKIVTKFVLYKFNNLRSVHVFVVNILSRDLSRFSSSFFGVCAIKQIVEIVRDAVQHTAGRVVAAARRYHDLRRFLFAIRLLALARIGDVRHSAHHMLPVLRARSRRQLDVALHCQRDVRHCTQSRFHVGAAKDLGRGLGGHVRRYEDLAVAAIFARHVAAESTTLVTAVARRVVDTASATCRKCRVNEHWRFLIFAWTRTVILKIDIVRMINSDFRQESAGRGDGGLDVGGWGFGHKFAHIYATRSDTSYLPIWLVDDWRRRRGSCWVVLHFSVSFRAY